MKNLPALLAFKGRTYTTRVRANWWLRSVNSATNAANVNNNGNANNNNASNSNGVRPDFLYHSVRLYAVSEYRKELLSLQKMLNRSGGYLPVRC